MSPAACSSRQNRQAARQPLRTAFKGSVRGIDDGLGSFLDDDKYRTGGKEQRGNEEDQNTTYSALENHVHRVTFRYCLDS